MKGVRNSRIAIWSRIKKTPTCWLWTGGILKHGGYGIVSYQGREWLTHRLIVSWVRGLPSAKQLHHKCENPRCVRPLHLKTTTDFQHRQIHVRIRTHFGCGHRITPKNTYWLRNKHRRPWKRCRQCAISCAVKAQRVYRAKKRLRQLL